MNALVRLVSAALDQADHRLGRLTTPASSNDRVAIQTIESSRAFQWVAITLATLQRASESSLLVAWSRRALRRWDRMHRLRRCGAVGILLLVSGGVYSLLTLWQGGPPGWQWLILPGTAIAVGGLLILTSAAPGSRTGHRDTEDTEYSQRGN
jgi:hypothetical protein